MANSDSAAWYAQLIKPWFAPPAWLFGPAWAVLYVIIAVSFGYVLVQCVKKRLPWSVFVPFALNLVFNFAYTPIQFGLIWLLVTIWNRVRWVAYANLPYLAWVSFATVLQLTITWLNR
jgi:benzodiazapine receptor